MGIYKRFISSSVTDIKDPNFYRALLGELVGTLFLVFIACNSPYGDSHTDLDNVRVSLSFGVTVATMVWILAKVSGGHINPAVSIAMLFTRKISAIRCILYIVFQCFGGILGAFMLKSITCNWQFIYATTQLGATDEYLCGLGLTTLGPGVTPNQGMAVELLTTLVLVLTVFATVDSTRGDMSGSGPLAIGLSVTVCLLGFIRQTGASLNPARTLGPAVVLGIWDDHWVYWAGPILGGIIASMLYEFGFAGDASMQKVMMWISDSNYGNAPISPVDTKECSEDKEGNINQGVSMDSVATA